MRIQTDTISNRELLMVSANDVRVCIFKYVSTIYFRQFRQSAA